MGASKGRARAPAPHHDHLAAYDIALETGHSSQNFVLLFFRDLELVESCDQMFDGNVPIVFCDAQAGVGGFHVLAGVGAGPAGGVAEEVDHVLTNSRETFFVVSRKEALQLGVGGQAADKVVGNRGEGVIAAESMIERWLLLGDSLRGGAERRDRGKGRQGEIQKRRQFLHVSMLLKRPVADLPLGWKYGRARKMDCSGEH